MKSFKKFLNAKTYSVNDLAKKHNISVDKIKKQLKMGTDIEKEHTKHHDVAKEIALDHIRELPNYYTRLKKMEK